MKLLYSLARVPGFLLRLAVDNLIEPFACLGYQDRTGFHFGIQPRHSY